MKYRISNMKYRMSFITYRISYMKYRISRPVAGVQAGSGQVPKSRFFQNCPGGFWGAPCGSGGVPMPLGVPPVPSWGPWGPIGLMGGAPPSGALGAL